MQPNPPQSAEPPVLAEELAKEWRSSLPPVRQRPFLDRTQPDEERERRSPPAA